jgi:hypothetical protein
MSKPRSGGGCGCVEGGELIMEKKIGRSGSRQITDETRRSNEWETRRLRADSCKLCLLPSSSCPIIRQAIIFLITHG